MAKTYEIAFKLAGKLSGGFTKAFQSANKTIQGMNKELNALNKQASDTSKLIKLRQEVGQSARSYLQAKQKLADMKQELSSVSGKPSQQMIAAVQKQKQAVDRAKAALDKKRAALGELDAKMDTAGTSLKELIRRENELAEAADKARRAQERLADINSKLDKANSAQDKLGSMKASSAGSLATIGAGVAGTMGVPVQQAMAMEDAMAEVRKVVDFDTPDGLANLQKQLEEMSLRIPLSADGLAQIAAAAGQSGIAAKDLATFTEQAAKMGVAFDMSAEESGTMMAKWQSGMGLSQKQTFALADSVNALSNSNAAQAKEIGETLQRYGALGKVAGMTEQQIAAFSASVIASGAAPEVAATGMKAFMRALGKGGSMTEKQAAAFENVGLNPKQLQKNLQKDAPATIISTLEAIQKNVPKEKWNQYLSVMFGEEASVAVGPMMQNLEGLKKNFELVGNSANTSGSMLKEFEARSSTTSNALTLAKNAAMFAARAVGGPLLEPLKKSASEFVKNAQKVGEWIQNNKELVLNILKVAGIIVGAITAFHAIRLAIAFVVSPIISMYKGFLLIQKGVALASGAFGLATSTIWIIIGAIVAAIAIGVLLWKNWDKIKAKCTELWAAFSEKFPGIAGIMTDFYESTVKPVIGGIKDIFGGLIDFVVGVFTGNWGKAWEGVKNVFSGIWESLSGIAKAPLNGIISMVNAVIGGLNSLNINIPDWVPGFGGKSFGVNIPKIPQLAEGGITTGPTFAEIGEGREQEAVLPLSKLDSLLSNSGRGGGNMTVSFAPVINISGGGADAYSQVKRGLDEGQKGLKRELEKLMRNQRRLSYA